MNTSQYLSPHFFAPGACFKFDNGDKYANVSYMKFATLVYQGGLANVFSHETDQRPSRHLDGEPYASVRERQFQGTFGQCEAYAAGLKAAGVTVRVAWCNEAGDIINSHWNFSHFEKAPFDNQFHFNSI